MDKKIGVIFLIILFFTPLVLALEENDLDANQTKAAEELSPMTGELEEALRLIKEMEREIALTHELLGIREEQSAEKETVPDEAFKLEPAEETPPELVIAKQTSEKPPKDIITREYGSRMSPPPPRSLPAVGPKRSMPPPTDIYRYSRAELEDKNYSIQIEKEQLVIIPCRGVKRFLPTNPATIEVSKETNEVSVRGIKLGRGFLHIWDSDGRKTLKIKVIQKGYRTFLAVREKAMKAREMDSFKVKYAFDRYRLNSNSLNPDRSYHYTEWFHNLGVRGETPHGMLSSAFQYHGKGYREDDFQRDLSMWNAYFTSPEIEASAGDVGAYFSDITLPHISYQGFRFRNPDEKKIHYDMMWGARGANMWGDKVVDYKGKNYFYGGRLEVSPTEFLNLKTTLMRSQGNDLETSEVVTAFGYDLNLFNGDLKVDSEYARGEYGDAIKIQSDLKSSDYNFDFRGVYRDIATDYELVLDQTVTHIGEIGYYLTLNYYPLDFLSVTGQYNKFRSRSTPSDNPKKHNFDRKATVRLKLTERTNFTWYISGVDRLGYQTQTMYDGQSYNLNHSFDFLGKNTTFYAIYEPAKYKNLDAADTSYEENKLNLGMKMNVLKNLYFDLSHKWHRREMSGTGDRGTARTINTGLSYRSQILDTPFYGSASFRYKNDLDVVSGISLTSEEKYWEWEGELKYRPSSEMEMYLRVNNRDISGRIDKTRDRDEMRIYCGGSYLFDTGLRFRLAGSVEGRVFYDIDGDGAKGEGEKGVSRVDIYAGESKNTTTDADGHFAFNNLKGTEVLILLDTKTLPEGFSLTTANPQKAALKKDEVARVDFGIIARTELSGIVFNDLDMDGGFDKGDYGAKNIMLSLEDGSTAYTDVNGYYEFRYVKPGAHTVALNPASLPSNLLPLSSVRKETELEKGGIRKENFALYALRTVIGTVFEDTDGNGIFDKGEKGLPDVEVRTGDNVTITDKNGRFLLKKLKSGAQTIEVDADTAPEGYRLSGEGAVNITLSPLGEIKEGVDFGFRP